MKHSSIPIPPELRQAIQHAELAAQALRDAGLGEQAAKLEEYIRNARKLKFSVGVVALAKRGKSTLINGLLGRRDDVLAPIDSFPATNVVSCFANAQKRSARILYAGDDEKAPGREIPVEDIKLYACEEFNPGNRKGVKVIEVMDSFPRLGNDVVLVDTPGAGNALNHVHDLVLMEFLPKLDAVIFMVTADEPLVASEVELLGQIRKTDVRKVLFAVNKVDKVDDEELRQGVEHSRRIAAHAGLGDAPFFEISARSFFRTGEDPGTERLIHALGETIGSGRASLIAERLAAITESLLTEAEAEINAALANSELTAEEIGAQRERLEEMRHGLDRNREVMERKFRSSWRAAFDDFEATLAPLQRQMIQEYTELVENTPSGKLGDLGGMIHTDVIKRLDELLQPHVQRLSDAITEVTKGLQVEALGSMGIEPREAEALITRKQGMADALGTALAGAPSLAGAAMVGAIPGLIGSAIMSAAPGVAVATWNPFTWIAAVASGAANATVTTTTAAVTGILTPFALVGTPLLVAYAGYRILSKWKHTVGRTRNELSIAVKDLIVESFEETRRNLKKARAKDDEILDELRDSAAAQISEAKRRLDELLGNRPSPEQLIELKAASQLIGKLKAPEVLPEADAAPGTGERLFP